MMHLAIRRLHFYVKVRALPPPPPAARDSLKQLIGLHLLDP